MKQGTKMSLESREKLRQSHLGKKHSIQWNVSIGVKVDCDKNGMWKGDSVSYSGLHKWVNRKLGKVKECAYCGGEEKRIEWASISHNAKRDLNDYIPLCTTCHREYDAQSRGGSYFGHR